MGHTNTAGNADLANVLQRKTIPTIRERLLLQHKQHMIPAHNVGVAFPFCYQRYASLEPMLLQLELRSNTIERKIEPLQLTHANMETPTKNLAQSSKNKIQDIYLPLGEADREETTSDEEETPRQNAIKIKR